MLLLAQLQTRDRNQTVPKTEPPSVGLEVIDVIDSEDEEIQRAISASLIEGQGNRTPSSNSSNGLEDVLNELQRQVVQLTDSATKIIVFRSNILNSSLRALERKDINLNARLYIKFSGEIGQDHGGPRLAITDLQRSKFFEGPDTDKVFTHDIDLVERHQYRLVGRLVALALVQEGQGLHFLNSN